ncbi:hypothetical protein FO519_005304 [Halicephalobus sp. NKZ332]|nr:hypothetical protein FO519_005304 [Halicephalobus sp. NKZ332]
MDNTDLQEGYIPIPERSRIWKSMESMLTAFEYVPPEDIYNKPWQWNNLDPETTAEKLIHALKYSPASRQAILDTVATLIHKDYFIFTEGPKHRYGNRHYELHSGVMKLLETIEGVVNDCFSSFLSDVVVWTTKILLTMTEYNVRRHRGLRQKPYELIKKSETGKAIFRLMKTTMQKCLGGNGRLGFKALLRVSPEVAKDEHGREWIFSYLTSTEQKMIRDELKNVCDELLNTFLRTIQASRNFNVNHIPLLKKITTSDVSLKQFIESCVPVSELNRQKLKLLHGFCYFCSPQFTYTVFSLLLISINTVPELKQFIVFASTVIPQYPNSLLESFKDIVKKKSRYLEILEKKRMEFNVIKNFALLLTWSELSENNSYMNFFCLKSEVFMPHGSVMELAGSLIQFSVTLLLEHLEGIEEFDQESFKKTSITVDLIKAIDGTAPMEPGACYCICRILASVYVHCLRLVKSEDYDCATMAILKMNEAIRHLLTQQKFEFPKELWTASLVKEVLLCSKEIFGIGKDLTGQQDPYRKLIEPCLLPEDCKYYEQEFCLLKNYRERPAIGLDQARLLAQTGRLPKSKRFERNEKTDFMAPELIRKYIFIYTVDYLITTPKNNPNSPDVVFDGSTVKEVGLTLVDTICGEKDLTSFYSWSDWIDDKHHLREFVTIENNIESTFVSFDLMQILAAAPSPSIYCIAPLIKAVLGYLINFCETSPTKTNKLPKNIIEKIENLFILLILARTETSTILISYEVLTRCSVHEAGAILFEIWRLLMILKVPHEKLTDLMHEISLKPVEQYGEELSSPHRDRVLAILLNTAQRNLKTMVDLVPKIIDLLSPEPDQDVWTNDLYPVGSVSGDLKKQ